jgi:hypothetical protein
MGIFDDLLGDTVDFFTGDVGDIVEDVVNVIKDDPVKAVAQAVAYVYAPWAIPLIEGVDIVQNGGDLNDVVEGMATVYAAQTVGTYTGKYVQTGVETGAVAGGYSAQTAQIAGEILGTGSGQASAAVVLGKDPVEAFKLGGISAGVGAGLGQIEGYAELAPYQQTAISTGLTATLSGENVTTDMILNAVIQAEATTQIMKDFTTENTDLSANQIGLLTNIVQTVASGSISGDNLSSSILSAIQKKGMTAFQDVFTDTVKSAFDKITGKYGTLQSTSDKINEQGDKYTSNVDKYNAVVAEMEPLIAEQNKLYDKTQDPEAAIIEAAKSDMFGKYIFNPATSISIVGTPFDPTNHDWVAAPEGPGFFISEDFRLGQRNRILAASKPIQQGYIQEYNTYATDLKDKYNPILANYQADIEDAQAQLIQLQTDYSTQKDELYGSAEEFDTALNPIFDVVNQTFVEGMDENFNPEEYASINNLTEDQDPYYHWLTEGKDQELYTNLDAYNSSVEGIAQNIADTAEIATEPFDTFEDVAEYVADQAEIAQTTEPDPVDIAIPQSEIAPEDEGEPTDPDMAEEVKDIMNIIEAGQNLPPQEGFEEFTEIQDPDDPDLQQTDPFLEEYLDQIDEQGEDFYGADDTEFMAGDQGGPGSTLGELGKKPTKPTSSTTSSTQAQQNLINYNNKIAMQQLQKLAQPTIMEPVESDKELGIITPYDFSSIFATPEEEKRLISPYDKNEELLKLVKRKV